LHRKSVKRLRFHVSQFADPSNAVVFLFAGVQRLREGVAHRKKGKRWRLTVLQPAKHENEGV
jgi:hypothetical protein